MVEVFADSIFENNKCEHHLGCISPNDMKQESPPHKQEAHPTPSNMQQSLPPDADSKHQEFAPGEWWMCE